MAVLSPASASTARRARILLLLFISAFVLPLALNPLPFTSDGRNHILRALLLQRALASGDWFARYFPELAFGFGAPLLNYYAPLVYYLTVGIASIGLGLSFAYQVVLGLALIGGAFGAAAWAKAWYGPRASLATGILWAAAPYMLYNVYTRGAGPEALGLAWLPWLGWALSEALHVGTLRSRLVLGAATAGLMLTHNLTALLGCGLLTIVGLVELAVALRLGRRDTFSKRLAWAMAAVALGLAASAFFWAPALLETSAIHLGAAINAAGYDFRDNFLEWSTLFAGPFTYDLRRVLTPVPLALGWGGMAFAALGALSLLRRFDPTPIDPARTAMKTRSLLLLALAGACVFMTLRLSQVVWETLPMAQLIQFPYRWMGPAALFLALIGGRGAAWLQDRVETWPWPHALRLGCLLALVAAVIVGAIPWTFAKPDSTLPAQPSIEDLYDAEVHLGTVGLTSTGEFLPIGADSLHADPAWAAAVYAGTADRLDRAALPNDVVATTVQLGRLSQEVSIDASEAATLTFRWLYWPGWQATLDGVPLTLTAAPHTGFIQAHVPAGSHRVAVWLGLTPMRVSVSTISDLAILIGAALAAWALLRKAVAWRTRAAHDNLLVRPRPVVWAVALSLALFRVGLHWEPGPFQSARFDGQTIAGIAQPTRVVFGDSLILLGLDSPVQAGDLAWTLTSYWTLARPIDHDLSLSFQLWDDKDRSIGQADAESPGGWPTRRWFAGEYAVETQTLRVDPAAPPGRYRLMATVYSGDAAHTTLAGRAANGPASDYVQIGAIQVPRSGRILTQGDVSGASWTTLILGPMEAVGVQTLPSQVQAGDQVSLDLYWRARSGLNGEHPRIILTDSERVVHDLGPARLTTADLAESTWEANDLWRIATTVVIPPNIAPGLATWGVRVNNLDTPVGAVTLALPERTHDLPDDLIESRALFVDVAELAGYRLAGEARPGGTLTVDLVWRSQAITNRSFAVFVHLTARDGYPAAQSDAVPVYGSRPTTGWLPPEVVTDRHTLQLPDHLLPDRYVLAVGLYDPVSGARVSVLPAGIEGGGPAADHLDLQIVEVPVR